MPRIQDECRSGFHDACIAPDFDDCICECKCHKEAHHAAVRKVLSETNAPRPWLCGLCNEEV
jgi:hypothetical protein